MRQGEPATHRCEVHAVFGSEPLNEKLANRRCCARQGTYNPLKHIGNIRRSNVAPDAACPQEYLESPRDRKRRRFEREKPRLGGQSAPYARSPQLPPARKSTSSRHAIASAGVSSARNPALAASPRAPAQFATCNLSNRSRPRSGV